MPGGRYFRRDLCTIKILSKYFYLRILGCLQCGHNELPDPTNVQDWTSKDIGKLPAENQCAWPKAQFEKLEALKKCNVYELADYLLDERLSKMVGHFI